MPLPSLSTLRVSKILRVLSSIRLTAQISEDVTDPQFQMKVFPEMLWKVHPTPHDEPQSISPRYLAEEFMNQKSPRTRCTG
jgi:hypothetical protein